MKILLRIALSGNHPPIQLDFVIMGNYNVIELFPFRNGSKDRGSCTSIT